MGKTRSGGKERSALQELKYENQRLKRENDQIRKQLARIDLDRYGQLKKTIEKHYKKEEKKQGEDILEKVKKEWACNMEECSGFLEIFLYNKQSQTWYFRKCSDPACKNRTKAQIYDPNRVKGIMKKETKDE